MQSTIESFSDYERLVKIRNVVNEIDNPKKMTQYSADEALALYIDARMTKESYLLVRHGAKDRNSDIYPSYDRLLEARKECYPDGIVINETGKILLLNNFSFL